MNALFKLMLKGSLVSLLAVAAATGCGDDSDDGGGGEAGEGNSGGAAAGTKNTSGSANVAGETGSDGGTASSGGNGGAPAEGGADPGIGGAAGGTGPGEGGAGAGGADAGGAGPDPFGGGATSGGAANSYEGPPIAKFCNTLTFPDDEGKPQPTNMRLEIGVGNDQVTFTATTGECVPADGEACTETPIGPAVLVSLFDVEEDTLPIDTATIEILQDEQLIFYSTVNEADEPLWDVRVVKPTFACEDITYDDVLAIDQ